MKVFVSLLCFENGDGFDDWKELVLGQEGVAKLAEAIQDGTINMIIDGSTETGQKFWLKLEVFSKAEPQDAYVFYAVGPKLIFTDNKTKFKRIVCPIIKPE